jgi:hypothetical protein
VKQIYTLLAPRPLEGVFATPLVLMERENGLQVRTYHNNSAI